MSRLTTLLCSLPFIFLASAMAEEPVPEPEYGIMVLEFENDLFTNEDRYYTNGMRASWITPGGGVPGVLRDLGELIPFFPGTGELTASWSLGQNMYTPRDIRLSEPEPDDRPYAGWLYVTGGLAEETGQRLDRLQLTLGIVGPASLAEKTQKEIHRLMGSPMPRGWDTQLKNEPTLMVSYERQWRALIQTATDGWRMDVTPHWGGTLGTPFTMVNTGLTLRAGHNLPHDYGPPRIQPALSGSGLFAPRSRQRGWYVFAGVDVRLMAYNVFLDGNAFRDSVSVDRELFVGDVQAGVVFNLGAIRLAYTHVLRTREFESQSDPQDDFGALSLSWIF